MCMRNETLAKVLDERAEIKNQMDILAAKLKDLESAVKEDMDKRIAKATEKGVDQKTAETYEFDAGETHYKVTYHYYEENRFNTDAFKKENPEMYEHYCVKSQKTRLTIK